MIAALLPASVKHCSSCSAAISAGSVVADRPAQRIAVMTADIRISHCAPVRASTLGARKKNSTSLLTPTTHSSEISAVVSPLAVQYSVE
ncbi:hypothetical protein G6F23_015170 [Rhizopus arrhizus]|nr:hypothetical protein G6F23_015170 [Rhizopus arrhizus]